MGGKKPAKASQATRPAVAEPARKRIPKVLTAEGWWRIFVRQRTTEKAELIAQTAEEPRLVRKKKKS
jgi:hypothetical protein